MPTLSGIFSLPTKLSKKQPMFASGDHFDTVLSGLQLVSTKASEKKQMTKSLEYTAQGGTLTDGIQLWHEEYFDKVSEMPSGAFCLQVDYGELRLNVNLVHISDRHDSQSQQRNEPLTHLT